MLEITRVAPHQTASLSECGGTVMLELEDGNGHAFRQALDAHDVGKVLAAARGMPLADEQAVCQGDLVVRPEFDRRLTLRWQQDGGTASVLLSYPDNLVFQEALKAHCKALMKPARTPIL